MTIGALPLLWLALGQVAPAAAPDAPPTARVKADFLALLDRPRVAPDVRAEAPAAVEDGLSVERFSFASQARADGGVERVPTLLVKPAGDAPGTRRPAVIVLHGTGGSKDRMRDWLDAIARRGMIGVAIDARYHGDRVGGAAGPIAYLAAITRAWRTPEGSPREHPFYYDTCWDLWRTLDVLSARPDVDPDRLAMLGTSMGGIQTWLAAAADDRVTVAVPAIAVQSFRWSLEHDAWQGRARTIQTVHDLAARDLKKPGVDAEVCKALWTKLIPGILDEFDAPSMLRLFAGRPLLILNGERDPNCPIEGARVAFAAAERAYREAGASDRLKIDVAEGVAHQVTPAQRRLALDWLARWLRPGPSPARTDR